MENFYFKQNGYRGFLQKGKARQSDEQQKPIRVDLQSASSYYSIKYICDMKRKSLLLLIVALFTYTAYSQTVVTEFWHQNGLYYNIHNIVEADDNTLLVECPMFEAFAVGYDLGCMIYKISTDGLLMDSLLIPCDDVPLRTLFEAIQTKGEKNIFLPTLSTMILTARPT